MLNLLVCFSLAKSETMVEPIQFLNARKSKEKIILVNLCEYSEYRGIAADIPKL